MVLLIVKNPKLKEKRTLLIQLTPLMSITLHKLMCNFLKELYCGCDHIVVEFTFIFAVNACNH